MKPSHVRRILIACGLALLFTFRLGDAPQAHAGGRPGAAQTEKQPDDCRPDKHVCQCR